MCVVSCACPGLGFVCLKLLIILMFPVGMFINITIHVTVHYLMLAWRGYNYSYYFFFPLNF